MRLFLNLGLRVGELAGLQVEYFDLDRGTLMFYRAKVDQARPDWPLELQFYNIRCLQNHPALLCQPLRTGEEMGSSLGGREA